MSKVNLGERKWVTKGKKHKAFTFTHYENAKDENGKTFRKKITKSSPNKRWLEKSR